MFSGIGGWRFPNESVCALYFWLTIVYVASSPYLLVFDDDRVIHEHMILHVELVRFRGRSEATLEPLYELYLIFYK